MSLNGVSFTSLIKIRPSHLFPVFFVVLEKRQRKRREQMRKCYFYSIAI